MTIPHGLTASFMYWCGAAGAIGTAGRYAYLAIKGVWGHFHRISNMALFVESMNTNHLPHIYHRLGRIDDKLGLSREEAPLAIPSTSPGDPQT